MPTHPDAIGYLKDLGRTEGIPWFEMICDQACSGSGALSASDLEILFQLFIGRASYVKQPTIPASPKATTGTTAPAADRLETIGPFNDFKRLRDTVVATLPRRVTVIFGANGSGKSSLCEALQILASDDAPRRPHRNVHSSTAGTPSFAYRFASDSAPQAWTSPGTYGARASVIKYFDTAIATSNIRKAVQPGRIVELSPFKLDIFETAKDHCTSLRNELQRKQSDNRQKLKYVLQQVQDQFSDFEGFALANLTTPTATVIDAEITIGMSFSGDETLNEKLTQKAELEKATSDEGLKLLKGEAAAMKALLDEVGPILNACQKLVEINPTEQEKALNAKEGELAVLAKALIPSDSTLDKLMALIRPASEIINFQEPDSTKCPLCKQELRAREVEIFRQYSALLTGELDAEIREIKERLRTAEACASLIAESKPEEWSKDSVLPHEIVQPIRDAGKESKTRFIISGTIDTACTDIAGSLKQLTDNLSASLNEKERLVIKARNDHDALMNQLTTVSADCQSLLYAKTIFEHMNSLREASRRLRAAEFWDSTLPDFSTILRKITHAAKAAYKELVVDDFKERLNSEYLALAEKDMDAFGVKLQDIGGEGTVTVDHHVFGEKIDEVLSEGEQRVHALALFFAELETCEQHVIVFDDPVSSFDYNYIGNYCSRLRDFALEHPDRQIIVLTHNWEFFVQIQTTLNVARLNAHMAVHVLEGCAAIEEYSENIDDLKAQIDAVLGRTGEPSKHQKEMLAGQMRRLIESIINTHVFNKQRHQYKQKSQQVSAFPEFTKVVPLLPDEAITLRDLFSKLSITEHDDPRNAYVHTDKAMFLTRYNSIKAIEAAIISRK